MNPVISLLKRLLHKKQHDKYGFHFFEAFIHRVVVYHDQVEIQYNYLPGQKLENPITTLLPGCSNLNKVVGPLGFEPRTNRL